MNKKVLSLGIAVLLSSSVYGAVPSTPLEKTNAMEHTVYGGVQEGAIVDRLGQLDLTLYGVEKSGAVNQTVDRLYGAIEVNDTKPTLKVEVDLIEWTYEGKIKQGSLIERMNTLERSINGRVSTDSLEKRITTLKKVVIGDDKPVVLASATIPQNHVFKISLDEPISTKTAKEGEDYPFTVVEDITDGNMLVVPEGTKGKAHVTKVTKARSFGRSGELGLTFQDITTIGGDVFSAEQGAEAEAQTKRELGAAGASVAGVALLGPVGLVGGFFVKGNSVEYPAGQEFYLQPTAMVSTHGAALDGNPKPADVATSATGTTTTASVDPSMTDVSTNATSTVTTETITPATATTTAEHTAGDATTTTGDTSKSTDADKSNTAPGEAVVVIKSN